MPHAALLRPALIGCLLLAAALAGCQPGAGSGFPTDAQIAQALDADFRSDPGNARAQDLVRTLGGEQGALEYRVRHVIQRAPMQFEARYDVHLKMARSGADSLAALYRSLVGEAEAAKLPKQDLAAYDAWLQARAAELEKTDAAQAATLRASLESLSKCYRDQPAGTSVPLMEGLAAQLAPERAGWFAEKLPSPRLALRCLPV